MNGSSINPDRAWQMALDQLRMDMPKAAFDTWVRDTSLVSFEERVFTVGTPNAYGREWLASRLTSTATRLLTAILNQRVEVQFVSQYGVNAVVTGISVDAGDDTVLVQVPVNLDRLFPSVLPDGSSQREALLKSGRSFVEDAVAYCSSASARMRCTKASLAL